MSRILALALLCLVPDPVGDRVGWKPPMIPKATIDFREADAPIRRPVTKFGGQPVWVGEPTWPLSRKTGRPMRFIGQVALDPRIFGPLPARMAYLFITDEPEPVDGTGDAEAGENAVVLQPGLFAGPSVQRAEGPTLYRMVERPGAAGPVAEPCEYEAILTFGEDHEPDGRDQEGFPNQVGGTPHYLQGEEALRGGPYRLLLQLDSNSVPFHLEFGDAGIGYALISAGGTVGVFFWQCT
jgi:hypothetical protein